MSILRMYTVRDVVSGTYGRPFFSVNNGTALRSIAMEVNNPDPMNVLYTSPDDFELYFLGVFADEDGSVLLEERPELLTRCGGLRSEAK